jgi:hypothetical protein
VPSLTSPCRTDKSSRPRTSPTSLSRPRRIRLHAPCPPSSDQPVTDNARLSPSLLRRRPMSSPNSTLPACPPRSRHHPACPTRRLPDNPWPTIPALVTSGRIRPAYARPLASTRSYPPSIPTCQPVPRHAKPRRVLPDKPFAWQAESIQANPYPTSYIAPSPVAPSLSRLCRADHSSPGQSRLDEPFLTDRILVYSERRFHEGTDRRESFDPRLHAP